MFDCVAEAKEAFCCGELAWFLRRSVIHRAVLVLPDVEAEAAAPLQWCPEAPLKEELSGI